MKILLLGGSGQLGYEVIQAARALNFEIVYPVSSEVNITDTEQLKYLIEKIEPNVLINAAAYTAVDQAEQEKEKAYEINGYAVERLAKELQTTAVRLIHLSTDYVFDGGANSPIKEDAVCKPLGVYGASKLVAEEAISEHLGDRALIIRTSSLHGRAGKNIVHTLLQLFSAQDQISFVSDQVMSPTWTCWLAEVLLDLTRMEVGGVVHASCEGEVSWFQFALEVWNQVQEHRPYQSEVKIESITTAMYPRPAKRPAYSVMSTDKLRSLIGREPLWWQEGIAGHLKQIDYRFPE